MSVWSAVKFKKEANLLDSKLYIIKAFFAVMTAYIFAIKNPILKLDTISVLFGLMLTLEPVTLTGIKNGLNQIYATVLGAISTVVIIYIFQSLGISMVWIISLSMALTLYVCLKIDYKAVSPVAIFTSIYMTQYIQKTSSGQPSIWLTFRLRLCALGTGVAIAIIFNLIFALISYRQMINRRVIFLINIIEDNLNELTRAVKDANINGLVDVKNSLPTIFNNVDWVYSLFEDMKIEYKYKGKLVSFRKDTLEGMQKIVVLLRNISHFNYDTAYIFIREELDINKLNIDKEKIDAILSIIIDELHEIKELIADDFKNIDRDEKILNIVEIKDISKDTNNRVLNNMADTLDAINNIKLLIKKIYGR